MGALVGLGAPMLLGSALLWSPQHSACASGSQKWGLPGSGALSLSHPPSLQLRKSSHGCFRPQLTAGSQQFMQGLQDTQADLEGHVGYQEEGTEGQQGPQEAASVTCRHSGGERGDPTARGAWPSWLSWARRGMWLSLHGEPCPLCWQQGQPLGMTLSGSPRPGCGVGACRMESRFLKR